jgi:hypothetical protein
MRDITTALAMVKPPRIVGSNYRKLISDLVTIGCELSPSSSGRSRLAFTFLDGSIHETHHGKIYVTSDEIRNSAVKLLTMYMLEHPNHLSISEYAASDDTVPRVFVTDVDATWRIDKTLIKNITALVEAYLGDLPVDTFWLDSVFTDERALNLIVTTERMKKLDLLELLDSEMKTMESEDGTIQVNPKITTWLVVLRALLKRYDDDAKELPSEIHEPWFIKLLSTLFGIAYGRAVQEAMFALYPKMKDINAIVAVFTSHGENAYKADEHGRVKCGVHTYALRCIVDGHRAHKLITMIYKSLEDRLGPNKSFIKGIIDRGIYNNGGGLRMPFSQKTIVCPSCSHLPVVSETCMTCRGYGGIAAKRWYGPTALLVGGGGLYQNPNKMLFYTQAELAMKLGRATAAEGVPLTPDGVFDTFVEPVIVSDVGPSGPKKRRGDTMAINSAMKRWGVEQQDGNDLLQSISAQHFAGGKSRNMIPLPKGTEQFQNISRRFTTILAVLFSPSYRDCEVSYVNVQFEDSSEASPPIALYINLDPKKGKPRCYNRRDHIHKKSSSVYFVIYREDMSHKGRCTIVQKCNNVKVDPKTRVNGSSCQKWPGEVRLATELPVHIIQKMDVSKVEAEEKEMRNILRSFFYAPFQMTEEYLQSTMVKYGESIKKRYKQFKPHPHIIGPTEEYHRSILAL